MPRSAARASIATLAAVTFCEASNSIGCAGNVSLPEAPLQATALNGITWPDLCLEPQDTEEHFFIIGDWGGIYQGPGWDPLPANQNRRTFVVGVDNRAQMLVAEQMRIRANSSQPRYVINIGDNFYWDGVRTDCGAPTTSVQASTMGQWQSVYEEVYTGPGLDGKVWMGVLGNHDYGGYMFTKGWDQAIAYTWGPSGRWLTPALYWTRHVKHPTFSIDYFFMDSNVNDAFAPPSEPNHNMCSEKNNRPDATCSASGGPSSPWDCYHWFAELWEEQIPWVEAKLNSSDADWKIVVTHFPPDFKVDTWRWLSEDYDIDLIISGHRHQQEVHYKEQNGQLPNTAWVVSGGGGGITSEGAPRADGQDDQYGFMDVTIGREVMKIESISHGGVVRKTAVVESKKWQTSTSTTTTTTTTTTTSTTSSSSTRTAMRGSHHDLPDSADDDDETSTITSGSVRASARQGFSHVGLLGLVVVRSVVVASTS